MHIARFRYLSKHGTSLLRPRVSRLTRSVPPWWTGPLATRSAARRDPVRPASLGARKSNRCIRPFSSRRWPGRRDSRPGLYVARSAPHATRRCFSDRIRVFHSSRLRLWTASQPCTDFPPLSISAAGRGTMPLLSQPSQNRSCSSRAVHQIRPRRNGDPPPPHRIFGSSSPRWSDAPSHRPRWA